MTEKLIELATYNNIEGVKKFIADGGDVNFQNKWGDTALIYAIYKSNFEIAVLLIDAGADKDLKNHKGEVALDYAKKENYTENGRNLIELLTLSLENRLKEKELRKRFEEKERTMKERLIKEFEEKEQKLLAEFEKKEKELTKILEEKEGKLLAGFQTKFNGLQYRNLNDLQSAKFISDYEKRIICGLLPMPMAKIIN
jgi:ankyrin repeat protein